MAIRETTTYQAVCDMCGKHHPYIFANEPDEDDLNNANEEFEFDVDGCWEIHNHKPFVRTNCHCAKHDRRGGIWCDECSAKVWEVEKKEMDAWMSENLNQPESESPASTRGDQAIFCTDCNLPVAEVDAYKQYDGDRCPKCFEMRVSQLEMS